MFEKRNCHTPGSAERLAGGTSRERLREPGKNPHRARRRISEEHNLAGQAQDAPGARCGCEFSLAQSEGREVVSFGSVERVDRKSSLELSQPVLGCPQPGYRPGATYPALGALQLRLVHERFEQSDIW